MENNLTGFMVEGSTDGEAHGRVVGLVLLADGFLLVAVTPAIRSGGSPPIKTGGSFQ